MRRKIIGVMILICSLCILGYSGYKLISYFYDNHVNEQEFIEIKDLIINEPVVFIDEDTGELRLPDEKTLAEFVNPFVNLQAENSDFVGWLFIPDTNIDYPVMQTPKNEQYYLHRNFHKKWSSHGCLFASAKSVIDPEPSMNIVIYGHHMRVDSMFHSLEKYKSKEFYENHKYIQFNTPTRYATYEVIAAFKTDVHNGTYKYYEFINGTEEEFNEFIRETVGRTPYTTSGAVYGDQFITLSTCAYHTNNGRYVVVAKRII